MRLANKLLDYLHSAFDKSAMSFVAFRARHTSDSFNYIVSNNTLTGYLGTQQIFQADLTQYSLFDLVGFLAAQPNMNIVFGASPDQLQISATVLVECTSSQLQSNGDCFNAYTSLLWSWMNTVAIELANAKTQISNMLSQLTITTANDEWLDEWGGYFGIKRLPQELDAAYSQRIIIEIMRPRNNNKAIENAILAQFGQVASVVDLTRWKKAVNLHNGIFNYDGSHQFSDSSVPFYGLFAVVVSYNLESASDPLAFAQTIRDFIGRFRAAGTQMESLQLSASAINDQYDITTIQEAATISLAAVLADTVTPSSESLDVMPIQLASSNDSVAVSSDNASMGIAYSLMFNGTRTFSGDRVFGSGSTISENLN